MATKGRVASEDVSAVRTPSSLAARSGEFEHRRKIQSTELLPSADRCETLERPGGGPLAVQLHPHSRHAPQPMQDGEGVALRGRDAGIPEHVREMRARDGLARRAGQHREPARERGARNTRHAGLPADVAPPDLARREEHESERRGDEGRHGSALAPAVPGSRCLAQHPAAARRTVAASTWSARRVAPSRARSAIARMIRNAARPAAQRPQRTSRRSRGPGRPPRWWRMCSCLQPRGLEMIPPHARASVSARLLEDAAPGWPIRITWSSFPGRSRGSSAAPPRAPGARSRLVDDEDRAAAGVRLQEVTMEAIDELWGWLCRRGTRSATRRTRWRGARRDSAAG